jgi:peptide/nickel transport system permease protein
MIVQYADFIVHFFTGDLYTSTTVRKAMPVEELVLPSAARTLFLFGSITLLSILAASVLTSVWRRREPTIGGKSILGLSILGSSAFPVGIVFIIVWIVLKFDLPLPLGGYRDSWGDPYVNFTADELVNISQHAILPILAGVLMVSGFCTLVFIMGMRRSQNVLGGTATTSHRLDGFWRALDIEMPFSKYLIVVSITSVLAVDLMFNYSGLGVTLWEAVSMGDFPVLMATFFLISLMSVVAMFILDLAVAALQVRPEKQKPVLDSAPIEKNSVYIPKSIDQILHESWTTYRKSMSGIVALLILIIMVVVALAAPLISTVENPNEVANWEPFDLSTGWVNPLPPSLSRSPHTGFLHPLGTDYRGQDIYSLTVYGFRSALVIAAIIFVVVTALALLTAIISTVTRGVTGFIEKGFRAVFTISSMVVLAIPPLVILVALQVGLSIHGSGITLAFCALYLVWSWSAIAKAARSAPTEPAGTVAGSGAMTVEWTNVFGAILHVTKYAMIIGLMTFMLLGFYGLGDPSEISWGMMIEDAYERNAIINGDWAWILSPFVAIMLLVSTAFVILHQLENAVESTGTTSENAPRQVV